MGHFNNSELSRGELKNEEEYFSYLDKFNVKNETSYIVKSMNDLPHGLSLEQIKEDINLYPQTQVLIIDGFNLMRHKGGIKNMRNSLSQTSRDLRQFFVKESILGIVIHQSAAAGERERKKKDDVQEVMISPPSILIFRKLRQSFKIVHAFCHLLKEMESEDFLSKSQEAKMEKVQ